MQLSMLEVLMIKSARPYFGSCFFNQDLLVSVFQLFMLVVAYVVKCIANLENCSCLSLILCGNMNNLEL